MCSLGKNIFKYGILNSKHNNYLVGLVILLAISLFCLNSKIYLFIINILHETMLSNIYSYITSFYYTEPAPSPIVLKTEEIVETKQNEQNKQNTEEKMESINERVIDEKNVYYNNFKQKQLKNKKNKKNMRRKK